MPKGKKVKLTKAQKALKKLEAKRKLRRDHLKREVEHGKISLKQLEKKWRQTLLKMRLPDFKQDAELLWHRFERVLDVKDYVISCLLDQFDDAETQYRYNLEANVDAINTVIATFRSRLAELRADYVRDVRDFAQMAADDADFVEKTETDDETYIRSIIFNMEKNLESSDTQSKVDYLAATDELLNKNSDVRQYLRSALESKMDNMWGEFKSFLDDYDSTVGTKRKDYLEQKVHYDQSNQLIDDQLNKTQRLYKAVEKSRDKLVAERENQPRLLADLIYEHKYFGDTFRTLKSRLKTAGNTDRELLRVVTLESNKALDSMKALVHKGETVLQIGTICRKLETQAEKVVPLPKASDEGEEEQACDSFKIDSARCPVGMMREWDHFDDLRHFWQHVGAADAQRMRMRDCVAELREENRMLCATLRAYLDGVSRADYRPVAGGSGGEGGGPKATISGTEHAKHMLK